MRLALRLMPADSVDAIVTDPPYGLSFMGKGWDQQVPGPDYWRECLRVAKPGAHLLAFGGTRTAHRLACAIEDAGWELRDCLSYLYGVGFPKSHDISKAIDREAGAVREVTGKHPNPAGALLWGHPGKDTHRDNYDKTASVLTAPATPAAQQWQGWGTALKPAWEPIYLARKPFKGTVASNVLEHGCGALNVDGCRVGGGPSPSVKLRERIKRTGAVPISGLTASEGAAIGRIVRCGSAEVYLQARAGEALGRWPANLVLDEDAAAMLDEQTADKLHGAGQARNGSANPRPKVYDESSYNVPCSTGDMHRFGDSGGASRFFYTAKASRSEREAGLGGSGERQNTHPTVKPIALMRWLVRLVTPPGGVVLDPFMGSGSTGVAAILEGARFIGVELVPAYAELAWARIVNALPEPEVEAEADAAQ